jgi:hypothetical protein
VFLGSASGIANGNPATAASQFESNQAGALMGKSVSGAGDVNGDGYADVIVATYHYDAGPGLYQGAAYVFLGSASGIADGNPATADTVLLPGVEDALFSKSVAGAGDVNGDGYSDVIVGAPLFDNEGAAFVFQGNSAGRPVLARQRRGDGSGIPVAAYGRASRAPASRPSCAPTMRRGAGACARSSRRVRPACPFGHASCATC